MPSRDAQVFNAGWLLQFESSCGFSPPVRAVLALINTIKQSPLSALAASLASAIQVGLSVQAAPLISLLVGV